MSIYDVQSFSSSAHYIPNNIVWGGDEDRPNYYYCLVEHTAGSYDFATEVDTGTKWGGVTKLNGVDYPHFFWLPSYGSSIKLQPKVKVIKFGDSYEQRTPDGINTTLLEIDYVFSNRTLQESTAILHFLKQLAGATTFVHTPSAPYDSQRKFVCRAWDNDFAFIDNFNIRAKFEEVSV